MKITELLNEGLAEGVNVSPEVSQVLAQCGSGELDCYDVMNSPKTPAEQQASKIIQQMYDDVSIDHHLHPDDSFEEIFNIIADQLEQDYGTNEGVTEGSDDPWGPQGNFAGDTPVSIGGEPVKRLGVGDLVSYLGQKAKLLAQSKDRKYSRIKILSDFGGTTKDVLTSDLKRLGGNVTEGIETVSGKKYDVDPNKYYVWAWDGAVVLYGEYDNEQDAKINLPIIEKKAIERLGPYAKDAFRLSSGHALLRRYDKKGVAEGSAQQLGIQQLASISDEALDKAYGYGRSSPGNTFGWQANLKSAAYAKQMIDKGVTDIEAISDAIHKGWNVTARAFVNNPEQFDDTAKLQAAGKLEAKLQQRAKLMNVEYAQLPDDEQEKDRVVARALLQAIKGEQGVAEGSTNDYFKRRKDKEDRIAGTKPPAKRTPRQTDYEKKRKEQGVAEGNDFDDEVEVVADPDSDKIPNLVMQFRKAIDVDGNHPIVFKDGHKVKLPVAVMRAFLEKYSQLKPADRELMQDVAAQSLEMLKGIVMTFKGSKAPPSIYAK